MSLLAIASMSNYRRHRIKHSTECRTRTRATENVMTHRQSVATLLRLVAAATAVLCPFQPGRAQAADIKVLTFLSSKPILTDVAPEFEGSTRHKLLVTYGSIEPLRDRVSAGEIADVMIS